MPAAYSGQAAFAVIWDCGNICLVLYHQVSSVSPLAVGSAGPVVLDGFNLANFSPMYSHSCSIFLTEILMFLPMVD